MRLTGLKLTNNKTRHCCQLLIESIFGTSHRLAATNLLTGRGKDSEQNNELLGTIVIIYNSHS